MRRSAKSPFALIADFKKSAIPSPCEAEVEPLRRVRLGLVGQLYCPTPPSASWTGHPVCVGSAV